MSIVKYAAGFLLAGFAAGCANGNVFGYAEDRCLGSHNQCQTGCASIQSGPARSACMDRCLLQEDRCYATGDDGVGSSIAQDSLIKRSRTAAEKQADYERWRANREAPEVDIEVVEKSPDD